MVYDSNYDITEQQNIDCKN